jgi:hypothetical protein
MRKDNLNVPQKDLEMAQAMQDKIEFDNARVAALRFGSSLKMSATYAAEEDQEDLRNEDGAAGDHSDPFSHGQHHGPYLYHQRLPTQNLDSHFQNRLPPCSGHLFPPLSILFISRLMG